MPFAELAGAGEELPRLSERWDLELARRELTQAEKELDVQYMQFVPTLDSVFQYGIDLNPPAGDPSAERTFWFAGLTLTVPLFDYRFYPEIGYHRAAARQARLELEDLSSQAESEWRQSVRLIREAEYFATTARTKARLADDTLKLARIAYASGATNALTVIDAQRTSQRAHVEAETRRLELELARLAHLRAVGRDATSLLGR